MFQHEDIFLIDKLSKSSKHKRRNLLEKYLRVET